MNKKKMISYIQEMIEVILESPELFHDGIDEEIIDLLEYLKKELRKEQ